MELEAQVAGLQEDLANTKTVRSSVLLQLLNLSAVSCWMTYAQGLLLYQDVFEFCSAAICMA